MSLTGQVVVFLLATVVAVPLSKRLGLGSVLGYLAAGVVIGPSVAKLVPDVDNVLHLAEFGVVLLLFLIGLELQPSRLWTMRRAVFGLGSIQVFGTALVLALVALPFGLGATAAGIAGYGLALSSTAFALQLLGERNELAKDHGQAAFGILLFQDLAVIPLLTLLPVLGHRGGGASWTGALQGLGVLVLVVLGGRYLVRPLFRVVARAHSQEVFTATALLVVIGTALAVNAVGMSMSLGAFLAGVLLAESEYKHELEADIEPFKGLLLGLFFIGVGMSLDVRVVVDRPFLVVALVAGLVLVKALVLYAIGRRTFATRRSALSLALSISQGGEFAFVLFGMAHAEGLLPKETSQLLTVVVGASMAVTPLLFLAFDRFLAPRLATAAHREFDVAPEGEPPVIIAGFGRVGQVVGRVLLAKRIPFTAMDASPDHIDFVRQFGNKVFYGDASRLDLLRAARADAAKVFVLAIDDIGASLRTARTVLEHFPHLTIVARARNRQHAYELLRLGIRHFVRETFDSSLVLTADVLRELGLPDEDADRAVETFRRHDTEMLLNSFQHAGNREQLIELARQARAELEQLFQQDASQNRRGTG